MPLSTTAESNSVDTASPDDDRAARLESFDPVIRAAVLASPPLSTERRDRLRSIFGGAR